jgi:hypothetical protein
VNSKSTPVLKGWRYLRSSNRGNKETSLERERNGDLRLHHNWLALLEIAPSAMAELQELSTPCALAAARSVPKLRFCRS